MADVVAHEGEVSGAQAKTLLLVQDTEYIVVVRYIQVEDVARVKRTSGCDVGVRAQRGLSPDFLFRFKVGVLAGLVFSVIMCAALGIHVLGTGYSHWHRACVLVAV